MGLRLWLESNRYLVRKIIKRVPLQRGLKNILGAKHPSRTLAEVTLSSRSEFTLEELETHVGYTPLNDPSAPHVNFAAVLLLEVLDVMLATDRSCPTAHSTVHVSPVVLPSQSCVMPKPPGKLGVHSSAVHIGLAPLKDPSDPHVNIAGAPACPMSQYAWQTPPVVLPSQSWITPKPRGRFEEHMVGMHVGFVPPKDPSAPHVNTVDCPEYPTSHSAVHVAPVVLPSQSCVMPKPLGKLEPHIFAVHVGLTPLNDRSAPHVNAVAVPL